MSHINVNILSILLILMSQVLSQLNYLFLNSTNAIHNKIEKKCRWTHRCFVRMSFIKLNFKTLELYQQYKMARMIKRNKQATCFSEWMQEPLPCCVLAWCCLLVMGQTDVLAIHQPTTSSMCH